jgi:hypothetical protein
VLAAMRPLPNPPPLRKGGNTKMVPLVARVTAAAVTPTTANNTTDIPSLVKRGRCYVGLAKSGILR